MPLQKNLMKNKILSSMVEFFKYEMEKTWEVTLDNYYHVKKVTSKLKNYLNN